MDRLGFSRRSPSEAANGAGSIQHILQNPVTGFPFLAKFFKTWLKLDIATLAAILTIIGTISGGLTALQGLGLKIYWWFTKFFTASISIASSDRLNREILNWIGSEVLQKRGTRILTARTEVVLSDAHQALSYMNPYRGDPSRKQNQSGKNVPIQYLPSFGFTWFVHERNIFIVRRNSSQRESKVELSRSASQYASAAEGNEPLVVMCLGRSVEPIKRFLETCRDFAEKQRESFVTVRVPIFRYNNFESWGTTILRPIRPLETVHFDEAAKLDLVKDIRQYLDVKTRKFYSMRGVPYRRGYLLHGPPGTGKTSLTLALASIFDLELYLLHVPSVSADTELARIFTCLPPKCLVLLEDIDAVGGSRDMTEEEQEEHEKRMKKQNLGSSSQKSSCTLSGLLNVLDGVASQEGRIVLMTSNFADNLDKALIRPGRIDKMILLGHINQESAKLMFLRMFATDDEDHAFGVRIDGQELQKLALQFCHDIPEEKFTPAQLQGYLLNLRGSPEVAVAGIATWVAEQIDLMEKEKQRQEQAAIARKKKKKERSMRSLVQHLTSIDDESEEMLMASEDEKEDQEGQEVDSPVIGAIKGEILKSKEVKIAKKKETSDQEQSHSINPEDLSEEESQIEALLDTETNDAKEEPVLEASSEDRKGTEPAKPEATNA